MSRLGQEAARSSLETPPHAGMASLAGLAAPPASQPHAEQQPAQLQQDSAQLPRSGITRMPYTQQLQIPGGACSITPGSLLQANQGYSPCIHRADGGSGQVMATSCRMSLVMVAAMYAAVKTQDEHDP